MKLDTCSAALYEGVNEPTFSMRRERDLYESLCIDPVVQREGPHVYRTISDVVIPVIASDPYTGICRARLQFSIP